jgi:hypothetical protein
MKIKMFSLISEYKKNKLARGLSKASLARCERMRAKICVINGKYFVVGVAALKHQQRAEMMLL